MAKKLQIPQDKPGHSKEVALYRKVGRGSIFLGDSLLLLNHVLKPQSVDLIVTSPPFGLIRKKEYGNVDADEYLQ